MSSLVFALGMLLSLGGAASIYSGIGIVEVERGWTAVIAGATALSAGIVTIGIAFVLRCLVRLQAFLEAEKGFLPLLSELALNQVRHNLRQPYPQAQGTAAWAPPVPADVATAALRARPQAEEAEAFEIGGRSSRGQREEAQPVAGPATAVPVSIDDIRRIVAAEIEPQAQMPGAQVESLKDAHEGAADGSEEDRPPEPSSSPEGTEGVPRPDIEAGPEADAEAPDRSEGREAPAREIPGSEARDASEAAAARPDRAALEEGASGEEARRVTARYESDGTSYVMYADGSIDACSERGALHFRSLTELKAFMDAQG